MNRNLAIHREQAPVCLMTTRLIYFCGVIGKHQRNKSQILFSYCGFVSNRLFNRCFLGHPIVGARNVTLLQNEPKIFTNNLIVPIFKLRNGHKYLKVDFASYSLLWCSTSCYSNHSLYHFVLPHQWVSPLVATPSSYGDSGAAKFSAPHHHPQDC